MTAMRVRRWSLAVEDWPRLDRLAWEAACRPAGPLDEPGAALRWAEPTRNITIRMWGRYLAYLQAEGVMDPSAGPAERVSFEQVGRFIVAMQNRLAPSTIDATLTFMGQAMAVFVPGRDWTWIRKHPAAPSSAEILAARKEIIAPDSAQLLTAALAECDFCITLPRTPRKVTRFRNALLVAFATCTAVRRRNLAEMRLGTHLLVRDHGMRVVFTGTKNHQVIDTPLTPMLTRYLRTYLETFRPLLLSGAQGTDFLWVNEAGHPLSYDSLWEIFQHTGRRLIGQEISVHDVRYGLATGIMNADPTKLESASAALAHRSTTVTRRSYDRSGADASNRVWTKLMERKRRTE